MNVDEKVEDCLRLMFGDMAKLTVEAQKKKMGLKGPLSKKDYMEIAENVRKLAEEMAGDILANRIYNRLIAMIDEEWL